MFFAKFVVQKQGEARVVDRRQVVRDQLEKWLETRPSAPEIAALGIIGRGERFNAARDTVDRLLRTRARAREAEAAKIPCGKFAYTDRVCALLGGSSGSSAHPGGSSGGDETIADKGCESVRALLEARLNSIRTQRNDIDGKIETASSAWCRAAEDCSRAVCTPALREASGGVDRALQLLEAHRASTGSSLAAVFDELRTFQRLVVRRNCLEGIVAMVERTEAVREAVFAWTDVEALPLAVLEEVPEISAGLPERSRAVAARRVQFLVGPLRMALSQEVQKSLQQSQQWPLDPASPPLTAANGAAAGRALRLCADLQRVQRVILEMRRRSSRSGGGGGSEAASGRVAAAEEAAASDEGLWACGALAAPLLTRFQYHFCRTESELCRLDKPEWAFKYLHDLASDHGSRLEKWLATASTSDDAASQVAALRGIDLSAGLAVSLAREARSYMRVRMPLLAQPEARPTLLHTLQHLIKFHSNIGAVGGSVAATVVFSDFDANRPVQPENGEKPASGEVGPGDQPPPEETSVISQVSGLMTGLSQITADNRDGNRANSASLMGGLAHLSGGDGGPEVTGNAAMSAGTTDESGNSGLFGSLMGGLSQLTKGDVVTQGLEHLESDRLLSGLSKLAEDAEKTASMIMNAEPADLRPQGFLDVWCEADASFVSEKLSVLIGASNTAWRPKRLHFGSFVDESSPEFSKEYPAAAELVTVVADLLEKARERAECLATITARSTYSTRVLDLGLRQVLGAIKEQWNGIDQLLVEASQAALLVESLEELCRFLDGYSFGQYLVECVDDANALRLGMLEKLGSSVSSEVRTALRRLRVEPGVFSSLIGLPLATLSRRLRPTNFQAVSGSVLRSLSQACVENLLHSAPFVDRLQLEMFVGNCRDDLDGVLLAASLDGETEPLQLLRDSCVLLALPTVEAAGALAALRKVAKCAPSEAIHSSHNAPEATGGLLADMMSDGGAEKGAPLWRQRAVEVFGALGVKELSVVDVLAVLGKRPELVGTLGDLQLELPTSAADLLSGALSGELLSGALSGISAAHELVPGSLLRQATMEKGSKAFQQLQANQHLQSLQTGVGGAVGELRSLLPGRLVTATVRSLGKVSK